MKQQYTITKRYGRKVSRDYQVWEFQTQLTKTIEVETGEEFMNECDKLFTQAKGLTDADIDSVSNEIQPNKVEA
jgi:hypothetical protein